MSTPLSQTTAVPQFYQTILQELSSCVSVVSMDGSMVLYQNALSLCVFGDITATNSDASQSRFGGIFDRLFSHEPSAYVSMMESLQVSKPWKAILEVPEELAISGAPDEEETSVNFYGSRAFQLESWLFQERKRPIVPADGIQGSLTDEEEDVSSPQTDYKRLMTCPEIVASSPPALRNTRRTQSSLTEEQVQALGPLSGAQQQTPPQRTMSFMKLAIASYSGSNAGAGASHGSSSPSHIQSCSHIDMSHSEKIRSGFSACHRDTRPMSHSEKIRSITLVNSSSPTDPSTVDNDEAALLLSELEEKDNEGRDSLPYPPRVPPSQLPLSKLQSFPTIHEEMPPVLLQSARSSQLSFARIPNRYHEINAKAFFDPGTAQEAILLLQNDVTNRVFMEDLIVGMSEDQLGMLSGIFPRHVLEHLFFSTNRRDPTTMGKLARNHKNVTILFMDIVGERH